MRLEVEHLRFYTWLASESDSKPRNQRGIVRLTKVGGKLRRRCCQGGEEDEGDRMYLCVGDSPEGPLRVP
jgi:hypothetical protein